MSETCPHCARMRGERDEALEALRQARTPHDDSIGRIQRVLHLAPQPARIVSALLNTPLDVVSHEGLIAVAFRNAENLAAADNMLCVYMRAIRANLPPGTRIETVRGAGYRMPAEAKENLRRLLGVLQ